MVAQRIHCRAMEVENNYHLYLLQTLGVKKEKYFEARLRTHHFHLHQ